MSETEKLYDELLGKAAGTDAGEEETPDELAEDEEILTEEQLEVERKITEYETEIEQLDAKLAEYKADSLAERKREEMRNMNYDDEQIERYIGHIEGETAEEIQDSVFQLTSEIPPAQDNYADPSAFNWAREKGTTADHGEIGKKAYERVKHKIFPFLRG